MYGSKSLSQFADIAHKEPSLLIEGLWDAPKALLLSLLKKNIIVVAPESRESKLFDDCPYFGLNNILDLPSWETLPGEEIAPSPDIVGRRMEILYTLLAHPGPHVVLAPLQAILQRVPSPEKLKPLCHKWKQGDHLKFSSLPSLLESLGYRRSPVVADKGEYAIR